MGDRDSRIEALGLAGFPSFEAMEAVIVSELTGADYGSGEIPRVLAAADLDRIGEVWLRERLAAMQCSDGVVALSGIGSDGDEFYVAIEADDLFKLLSSPRRPSGE